MGIFCRLFWSWWVTMNTWWNIKHTLMWFHLLIEISQIHDRERGQLHMCIKKSQAAPQCRHVLRMSLHNVPRLWQGPRKHACVHQAHYKCTLDDDQEAHRPSQLWSMLKCDRKFVIQRETIGKCCSTSSKIKECKILKQKMLLFILWATAVWHECNSQCFLSFITIINHLFTIVTS